MLSRNSFVQFYTGGSVFNQTALNTGSGMNYKNNNNLSLFSFKNNLYGDTISNSTNSNISSSYAYLNKSIKTGFDLSALLKSLKKQSTVKTEEKKEEPVEEKTDNLNINGEFDETIKQGQTGDCWILSSLLALNTTDAGKSIIKNAISMNNDGSVSVNFAGLNKSFTVTADDIKEYDTDDDLSDGLSNGDNDALAFEIAVAKLRIALANDEISTGKYFADYNNGATDDFAAAVEGGYDVSMFYYMTGKTAQAIKLNSSTTKTYKALNTVLNYTTTAKSPSVVIDLGAGFSTANCTDGSTYESSIDDIHSIAMKSITENTITFIDPWDTSKEYTMTWQEFSKLNVAQIAYIDLG